MSGIVEYTPRMVERPGGQVEQLKEQVSNLEQSLATIMRELVTQHDQLSAIQAEAHQAQTVAVSSTQTATEAKAALQTWEAEDLRRRQELDGVRREVEALREMAMPRSSASRDLSAHQLLDLKEQATAMSSKLEVEMLQQMKLVRSEQREELAVLHAEQRSHAEDSAQFRRELWSLRETMPSGRAVQSLNERCAELDRALMSHREEQQQLTSGFRAVQECLSRWQTRWPALTSKHDEFSEELRKYREEHLYNHKVTLEKMHLVEANILNGAANATSKSEAVEIAAIRSKHEHMATEFAALRRDHEQLQKTLEAKHVEAINSASSVSADLMAQRLEHQSQLREVMDHIRAVEAKHPEAMKSLATLQEEMMTHRLEHQNKFKSALNRLEAVEGKSGEALSSLSTVTEALMSHRLENQNKFKSALDRIQTVEGKSAEAVTSSSAFVEDLMSQHHEHRTTLMEVVGKVEGLEARLQEASLSIAELSQASLSIAEDAGKASLSIADLSQEHAKKWSELTNSIAALEATTTMEAKQTEASHVRKWAELADSIAALEAKQTEAASSMSTISADMAAQLVEQRSNFKLALDGIQVTEAKHAEAVHSSSYLMSQHMAHEKKVVELIGKMETLERQLPEARGLHMAHEKKVVEVMGRIEAAERQLPEARGLHTVHEKKIVDVIRRIEAVERQLPEEPVATAMARLQALEAKQAEAISALQAKQDAMDKVQAVEAKHVEVLEAHAILEAKLTQAMIVVESKHTEALRALETATHQNQQLLAAREAPAEQHQHQQLLAREVAALESTLRHEVNEHHSRQQNQLDYFMHQAGESLQHLMAEVKALRPQMQAEIQSRTLAAVEESLFDRLDTNHDGNITRQELYAGLRAGLFQETEERPAVGRALERGVDKDPALEKISLRTATLESEVKQIGAALTSGWIASRLEALEKEDNQIKQALIAGQIPMRLDSLELKLKDINWPLTSSQMTASIQTLESKIGQINTAPNSEQLGQMAATIETLESKIGQIKTAPNSEQLGQMAASIENLEYKMGQIKTPQHSEQLDRIAVSVETLEYKIGQIKTAQHSEQLGQMAATIETLESKIGQIKTAQHSEQLGQMAASIETIESKLGQIKTAPNSEQLGQMAASIENLEYKIGQLKTAQHSEQLGQMAASIETLEYKMGQIRTGQHSEQLGQMASSIENLEYKMGQIKTAQHSEQMEDMGSKTDEQIAKVNIRLETLQTAWKTGDANIQKLLKSATEAKADTIRMDSQLLRLDRSLEGWRQENLGMSDRLEWTKRLAEDNGRNLQKLESNVAAKNSKLEDNHRRHGAKIHAVEANMLKLDKHLTDHDQQLGVVSQNIGGLTAEMETFKGDLQEEKKTNEEQEAVLRKLNVRQAIEMLYERVGKADEDIANVLAKVTEEEGAVRKIAHNLDNTIDNVDKHRNDMLRLDKLQQNLSDQCRENSDRLARQEDQHSQLSDRTVKAELDIKKLLSFQDNAGSKFEANDLHLQKVDSRLQEHAKRHDSADLNLQKLRTDLMANDEATAQTAMSLDLAHEYLTGVGKGLQGVQKHVQSGHEDLLPYKKGPPRMLPSLPRGERGLSDSFKPSQA